METLDKVVDAFKIPLLTSVLTIFAILLKDYFSIRYRERKEKEARSKSLLSYFYPIFNSASSVYWRIREIFSSGYEFLLEDSPKNKFNTYKYISSIYRLMALIGWSRVIEKELTYIHLTEKDKFKSIENSMAIFKSVLSDGIHVEYDRIKHICNYWNIDLSNLDIHKARNFGTELEKLMWIYFDKYNVDSANLLEVSVQDELNIKIVESAKRTLNVKIDKRLIASRKEKVLSEIKRIESWIYRDWQTAIGDFMITKNQQGTNSDYEIKSYGEFELEFNQRHSSNSGMWILRVEDIFKNLDPKNIDRFDSRIEQLKNICSASLEIIEALNQIDKSSTIIPDEKLIEMREFDMNNNSKFYL